MEIKIISDSNKIRIINNGHLIDLNLDTKVIHEIYAALMSLVIRNRLRSAYTDEVTTSQESGGAS